jgi:hypothetical protein
MRVGIPKEIKDQENFSIDQGGVRGNGASHVTFRSDLRGARRDPLLCHQYAGRLPENVHHR